MPMNDAAAVKKVFTATTAVVSTEKESAASGFSRETRFRLRRSEEEGFPPTNK